MRPPCAPPHRQLFGTYASKKKLSRGGPPDFDSLVRACCSSSAYDAGLARTGFLEAKVSVYSNNKCRGGQYYAGLTNDTVYRDRPYASSRKLTKKEEDSLRIELRCYPSAELTAHASG